MTQFKVGDKVRRLSTSFNKHWEEACRTENIDPYGVYEVNSIYGLSPHSIIGLAGAVDKDWEAKNFELVEDDSFLKTLKTLEISDETFDTVKKAYDFSKTPSVDWKQIAGIIDQWQMIKKEFNGGLNVDNQNFKIWSENNVLFIDVHRNSGKTTFLSHRLSLNDTVMVKHRNRKMQYAQNFAVPHVLVYNDELRGLDIPLLYLEDIPKEDVKKLAKNMPNRLYVAIGTY